MGADTNSITEALPSVAQAILPVPQVTYLRAARYLAPNALSFSAVGPRHAVPGARTWLDRFIIARGSPVAVARAGSSYATKSRLLALLNLWGPASLFVTRFRTVSLCGTSALRRSRAII
jgi:hypothetical protein